MQPFDELLRESVAHHGHLCPGQVLGVRLAMLGCRMLEIEDPRSEESRKDLIVFVEIDRCATDAIESVTGCRMGRRTLRFHDYGIMAATFWSPRKGRAYRIVALDDSREKAALLSPGRLNERHQQLEAYVSLADEDLFSTQRVSVDLPDWEMPGSTRRRVRCSRCGQIVRDGREVYNNGSVLCIPCTGQTYFRKYR